MPRANRNEVNPPATAAAKMSENLDFSAPDRVNDALFNQILWTMMKGERAMPKWKASAPLQLYEGSR
jgi:hypothetical protein